MAAVYEGTATFVADLLLPLPAPEVFAAILEAAQAHVAGPLDVLVLDCGTGFLVACLADLLAPGSRIVAVERHDVALSRARTLVSHVKPGIDVQWLHASPMTHAYVYGGKPKRVTVARKVFSVA